MACSRERQQRLGITIFSPGRGCEPCNRSRNYSLEIEAVKTDGDFTFISSSNPSALGEEVTFTVSASGNETPQCPANRNSHILC